MQDLTLATAPAFGLAEELRGAFSEMHTHDQHQVLYASSGVLHLVTQQAQWLLPPQRAAWISAGVAHQVQTKQASLRTFYLRPHLCPPPHHPCAVFSVSPLAREMLCQASQWGPEHPPEDPIAQPFMEALARMCHGWSQPPSPFRLPRAQSPELQRAMDHCLAHLGHPITLGDSAQAAGLSPRTLARRFEAEVGLGWRRFLTDARMMKAMELLAQPGARVTDVALDVGFESLGAFSRAFERFTGEAPSHFRARAQGGRLGT